MKQVIKYRSDDGVVYDTEKETLIADADYHRERSKRLARIEAREEEANRGRQSYDGGHQ